jgi:hypothetical protein
MTAINVVGPNAFALPHLPAAFAIRGASHFMPFLAHRLSRECRSFDDVLKKIVRTAREVASYWTASQSFVQAWFAWPPPNAPRSDFPSWAATHSNRV